MRGRLIFPFVAEIMPLDTVATKADPDGGGVLTSGYDEDFRTTIKILETPTDQTGKSSRVEGAPILIRTQIEVEQQERLQMMLSGDSPEGRFRLIFHYKDFERLGLLDSDNKPTIKKGDRLSRLLDTKGNLVEVIPDPPGLYVHQVMSRGWGLGGTNPTRNLIFIDFEERATSVPG
jgi:hypothetical protein